MSVSMIAQTVATFESFNLDPESFLNGSEGTDGYTDGPFFLPNTFANNFWAGWSISNTTDVTTPGFMNQYSAATGEGFDNSSNYAVAAVFSPVMIKLNGETAGSMVDGMYITNGTYANLSMLNGDAFAKRFGGEDGTDPDFFLLTIQRYFEGVIQPEKVEFYLADYRFENSADDYIVDEWTWVDLTSLGNVDSLVFSLSSSDVTPGVGMNTPAYFCADNFTLSTTTSVNELESEPYTVYPNPFEESIQINNTTDQSANVELRDMMGRLIRAFELPTGFTQLSIPDISDGTYLLSLFDGEEKHVQLIIKH